MRIRIRTTIIRMRTADTRNLRMMGTSTGEELFPINTAFRFVSCSAIKLVYFLTAIILLSKIASVTEGLLSLPLHLPCLGCLCNFLHKGETIIRNRIRTTTRCIRTADTRILRIIRISTGEELIPAPTAIISNSRIPVVITVVLIGCSTCYTCRTAPAVTYSHCSNIATGTW